MKTKKRSQKNSQDALDQALRAWQQGGSGSERLSADARAHILTEAVRTTHEPAPLPRLFTPLRRLVMAGALPVLLTAALVGLGTWKGPHPARIQALKNGNNVIFTIANGGRAHAVYKSTQPDRFDPASRLVVTDGAFVDQTDAGEPDLVFYRID